MADPVKKKVADVLTNAATKAAKKRKTSTTAAASKTLGQGKGASVEDVARAANADAKAAFEKAIPVKQPSGRGNPAARKLGVGQRPQPAEIAKSKAPNAAEAAKSLKSKSAQKGGAARQATGNKSGTSGKFEKGQKKAPMTRTEKAGIAGATAGTAAFIAKDRNQSGRNVTMADKMAPMKEGPKGSTEAQMESARAAEKKRYEARKAAALARAKAQSDFSKKKDSEKGYLRDSEGKRVKSGSGEYVRTGYYKGGRVKKPMPADTSPRDAMKPKKARPGYSKGGAVKGCGMAKRGLGKGMKK
jgi:hypothetical protein